MSAFIESILAGVIANFVFTLLLIWGVQELRYWFYLKRKFHNRQFETYWKMFPEEVAQNVTCTVDKNKIKYTGRSTNDNDSFEGEFIINPVSLKMGEGFHTHTSSDGFGFSRMIIRGDSFFVEAPYTGVNINQSNSKEGVRIYQAFIWKRKK